MQGQKPDDLLLFRKEPAEPFPAREYTHLPDPSEHAYIRTLGLWF